MRHISKTCILVVALSLISAATHATTTFTCAPEARAELCSPSGLWWIFEENSQRTNADGEPRYLISDFVTEEEAIFLRGAVGEEDGPGPEAAALVARLPTVAQLAWKFAVGEVKPAMVAQGARAISDGSDQAALLRALTSLERDAELVEALSWTLRQESARAITQPWFLRAGNNEAVNNALNDLIQCDHGGGEDCAIALPEAAIFSAAQLQAAWPNLSTNMRRSVLWRTSAEGVEDFLRHELLKHGEGMDLPSLWSDADAADDRIERIVAQLILERLLNPAVISASRLQVPITATSSLSRPHLHPYAVAEIRAWNRLAETPQVTIELWSALASSRNHWVKLLGIGGLIAADRQSSLSLVTVSGSVVDLSRMLAELLEEIDTPAADQVYRQALRLAPENLDQACAIAKSFGSGRARRLAPEVVRWVQLALAAVPLSKLPLPEELLPVAGETRVVPFRRSLSCVLDSLPKPTPESVAHLQPLADWLLLQGHETWRLLGATLLAELGNVRELEIWVQAKANASTPLRVRLHQELQRGLDRTRARHVSSRASEAQQACHRDLQGRDVEIGGMSPGQWSTQVDPDESMLLKLSIPSHSDALHAECRVEFIDGARVIMLQFSSEFPAK